MAPSTYQLTVLQAEQKLLSNLIFSQLQIGGLLQQLKPNHFSDSRHQVIYSNMVQLMNGMFPFDAITLKNHLLKNNQLEIAGGFDYVDSLRGTANDDLLNEEYYRVILAASKKKRLGELGDELTKCANDPSVNVEDTLNKAISRLEEIHADTNRKLVEAFSSVAEKVLYQALPNLETSLGCQSGFVDLDKITGGFSAGELIVIAARPAMGKTAFVLSIMMHHCMKLKEPAAYFSLEMSNEQIVTRLLSYHSELDASRISRKRLEEDEFKRLHVMTEAINDSPLYLADQSISTIQQIRFLAIRMKRQYGIKLLVIDYLQLIGTQSHRSYNNSRELEIATITRGLKTLARELNIPIIIASQLSRAVETRTGDKRPILSDLRESGAIEQEADKVLLLYRGEYYGIETDYDGQSTKDVAEVIVAKNRSGPVSTARLRFIARHARFENFDEFNSPDRYLDEDIEKRIKNKFKIFDRQSEDNLSIPF